MASPEAFAIISFDGHDFGPTSQARATFRMHDGAWQSTAAVGLVARRNATPIVETQSLNATTLPPLHVTLADDATITPQTFWNMMQEWFSIDRNDSPRYLHRWHHDGVAFRQVRIGCYVDSVAWDKRGLTHFVITFTAPGGWEDADASVLADPPRISNFGSRDTHPTITLTTTTHKSGRICTVTGIDALNYRIRFALNDTAATSTNTHVYVNGVLSESYVTGSGLSTSAVWAKVDIARDAYTAVLIVYGTSLVNPLAQSLDDGGIDFVNATNSSIVWDDISVSGQPGDALCWQLAKTGNTGGVSGGSYELTDESTSSLAFTRYTDSTGAGDADSIAVVVPSGLTSITHMSRATTGHAPPSITIGTTTGGSAGVNEVQSIALAATNGGTFALSFAGKASATVTTILEGGPGANEIQEIALTGNPTGGTFILTFDGSSTHTLAYNATTAAIEAALMALPSMTGTATASSLGTLPSTAFRVEFTGGLGNTNVPQITVNTASLTTTAQTTAPIAWNADAAAVQAALLALSNFSTNTASVTGGPLPANALAVEFIGALAETNVPQLTGSTTGLLGSGARSYARGWIAGSQRPTTAWSTTSDATVTTTITLSGAQRVAVGTEYTTATPQTGSTLTLAKGGGSWTGAITTPPTVVVGAAIDLDYYDGDVQIGDGETLTFDGYLVPDGSLVIDCEARTVIPADTTVVPIGLLDYDADNWLSLKPGNQLVTNTTGGSLSVAFRSAWG